MKFALSVTCRENCTTTDIDHYYWMVWFNNKINTFVHFLQESRYSRNSQILATPVNFNVFPRSPQILFLACTLKLWCLHDNCYSSSSKIVLSIQHVVSVCWQTVTHRRMYWWTLVILKCHVFINWVIWCDVVALLLSGEWVLFVFSPKPL